MCINRVKLYVKVICLTVRIDFELVYFRFTNIFPNLRRYGGFYRCQLVAILWPGTLFVSTKGPVLRVYPDGRERERWGPGDAASASGRCVCHGTFLVAINVFWVLMLFKLLNGTITTLVVGTTPLLLAWITTEKNQFARKIDFREHWRIFMNEKTLYLQLRYKYRSILYIADRKLPCACML